MRKTRPARVKQVVNLKAPVAHAAVSDSSCTRMAASFRPFPFLPQPIAYSADRLAHVLTLCQLAAPVPA
jgi:hypothetical protein